ncbi:hypothetical protein HHX47_DHR2001193 [Lentinula edodes]|nr:hypothetical protein HHX47_DHR2001193 [Lentinula edodes]
MGALSAVGDTTMPSSLSELFLKLKLGRCKLPNEMRGIALRRADLVGVASVSSNAESSAPNVRRGVVEWRFDFGVFIMSSAADFKIQPAKVWQESVTAEKGRL